jgi:hypothetical protein
LHESIAKKGSDQGRSSLSRQKEYPAGKNSLMRSALSINSKERPATDPKDTTSKIMEVTGLEQGNMP